MSFTNIEQTIADFFTQKEGKGIFRRNKKTRLF